MKASSTILDIGNGMILTDEKELIGDSGSK
jgi:hypothetical protein